MDTIDFSRKTIDQLMTNLAQLGFLAIYGSWVAKLFGISSHVLAGISENSDGMCVIPAYSLSAVGLDYAANLRHSPQSDQASFF